MRLGEHLVTFPARKTLAPLIYLVTEGGMQLREHLAALLWPEASPERSRASWRNTLGHLQTVLRQASGADAYTFTNDMLRDVVYTEAGDVRRRLFHRRALNSLEAVGDSAEVLAHHALAAGREALRISAVSESIAHTERARQFVRDGSLPKIPDEADLRDLDIQLELGHPE